MKKLAFLVLFCTFAILGETSAQTVLFEENFNNSTGTLTVVNTDWTEYTTGSTDVEEVSGSLTYSGYPSSGVGNKIILDGGATGRSGVIHSFASQSSDGSTVYVSFLLKVTSTSDMDINTSDGDIFFNLTTNNTGNKKCYLYVRQASNTSKFNLGIAKSSSASLTWHSTELNVNTTYLVVVAYSFVSGSGSDEVKLWVNPDLSGSEPTEDVLVNSGTDASEIENIQFQQNQYSGDMEVDGLRVSTSWSTAPLPVELSDFHGYYSNGKIILNWRTESEVNNYGFEVERVMLETGSRESQEWTKAGFINGNGNSNIPEEYSFEEKISKAGTYKYRLKQIDFDGNYIYSKETEVNIPFPGEITLNQNYPNPFNPSTNISFALPKTEFISLKIYDVLGREVETLLQDEIKAGTYDIQFDGSGLNSGLYFYKIEGEDFSMVKKMVLVK